MGRLRDAVQSGGAVVPFFTAGHPDLESIPTILDALTAGGATAIEVGIPFSDPIADGPVIQASSFHALQQGATLPRILEKLEAWITPKSPPILLMSYFNPVLMFGLERFAAEASRIGVSGVLLTDLPPEESEHWCAIAKAANLDTVFLATPTSPPERLEAIAKAATGFVYAVARTGITGTETQNFDIATNLVKNLKKITDLPILVGFGISSRTHALSIHNSADGVIVGSVIVNCLNSGVFSEKLVGLLQDFQSQ